MCVCVSVVCVVCMLCEFCVVCVYGMYVLCMCVFDVSSECQHN